MIKCGLISQKGAHSDMTTIILNDQWNLFISEYELVNVEINKSKVGESVGNKFFSRGMHHLSKLVINIILHISKQPNNTALVIFFQ